MNRNRNKAAAERTCVTRSSSLLILAQPSAETDELLEPLVRRTDLCVLRVASLNAAELALRDVSVNLILVCAETEAAVLTAILARAAELRPGTPVLALRAKSDEQLIEWQVRTVGILLCPILPEVLSRTVDVVLGFDVQPPPASKAKQGQ